MNKLKLNKKITIILFFILVFFGFLLFLTLNLTRQRQEIRKRAAGTGKVKITLEPTGNVQRGETLTINIKLEATERVEIGAGGVELEFNPNFFSVSETSLSCNNSLLPTKDVGGVAANKISLSCHKTPPFPSLTAGQKVTFGTFQATVLNNASGQTEIRFLRTEIADVNLVDVSEAGTPGTYTIAPLPTPTWAPNERCRLSTDKQSYSVGEQVTVYVSQNPKFADNDACYYRSMEVKEDTEIRCTASGFGVNARTQSCIWNTTGARLGGHYLMATYGGHSDNNGVIPTPGPCDPNIPCCDGGYNCSTIITLNPTSTPTPTPTATVPPGQVKIQVKIKFYGIDEKKSDQQVRIFVRNKNFSTKSQDVDSKTVTADNQGVYQTEILTLSSNITAGDGYYLLIKGPKHLQIRYCKSTGQNRPCNITGANITLQNGENVLDFTAFPLPPGDLPHPIYGQDGIVNAIDAVYLTDCMKVDSPSADCLSRADLNLDGALSSIDTELLNWTIFTRYEDREDE